MHRPLLSPPLVPRLSRRKYTQTVSLRVFIIFFRARARSFLTYGYAGVGRFLDKSGRFSVDSFDPRSSESPNLTQIREIAARRGYLFAHCRLTLSLSLRSWPPPPPPNIEKPPEILSTWNLCATERNLSYPIIRAGICRDKVVGSSLSLSLSLKLSRREQVASGRNAWTVWKATERR